MLPRSGRREDLGSYIVCFVAPVSAPVRPTRSKLTAWCISHRVHSLSYQSQDPFIVVQRSHSRSNYEHLIYWFAPTFELFRAFVLDQLLH
jgi:hypothetical protein